jgi:tripartite-type tricarboxylate transporter receptor subunit TctC
LLKDNAGWDIFRNFQPVTIADQAPYIVVVHPSVPVNSIRQLIAFARSHPGALNYASVGTGSGPHLAAELFKSMARVDIVHVPYKGSAPGLNDTISGQMQVNFSIAGVAVPHIKSGRLRALAVTSLQRSALAPELPTVAAAGLPGYVSSQLFGIYAPAATPTAIVSRLNLEIARALNSADVKTKLLAAGLETVASSPEETVAIIKADMARMSKVIRDAGIRAE